MQSYQPKARPMGHSIAEDPGQDRGDSKAQNTGATASQNVTEQVDMQHSTGSIFKYELQYELPDALCILIFVTIPIV